MSDQVCKSLSGEVLFWKEARVVGVTSLTTREHAPMLQHHLASLWPRVPPWTPRLLYLPFQVEKWGTRMDSGLYCCICTLSCWAAAAALGCMSFLADVTLAQGFLYHISLLPATCLVCSALHQDCTKSFITRVLSCYLHLGAREAVTSALVKTCKWYMKWVSGSI